MYTMNYDGLLPGPVQSQHSNNSDWEPENAIQTVVRTGSTWNGLGLLFSTGVLKNREVMNCPAETTLDQDAFDWEDGASGDISASYTHNWNIPTHGARSPGGIVRADSWDHRDVYYYRTEQMPSNAMLAMDQMIVMSSIVAEECGHGDRNIPKRFSHFERGGDSPGSIAGFNIAFADGSVSYRVLERDTWSLRAHFGGDRSLEIWPRFIERGYGDLGIRARDIDGRIEHDGSHTSCNCTSSPSRGCGSCSDWPVTPIRYRQ